MALQHRRHQLSLTGFIPKPKPPSLTPEEYGSVQALFKTLIEYASNRKAKGRYKPAALISQTFQHVKSTDEFLIHFFVYTYARIHPEVEDEAGPEFHQAYTYFGDFSLWNSTRKDEAAAAMDKFAQYMIDNFFMPLRASSVKTPQPTPASLSSKQSTPTGTRNRVSRLRQACLLRDHHRCVVSRMFDRAELKRRLDNDEDSTDDDGKPLKDLSGNDSEYLEVAHIIPHSLTSLSPEESELSESKKAAHHFLTMFDPSIVHLIEGQEIDSPKNALTLTHKYHRLFGEFEIYFEPTDTKYEYKIESTEERASLRDSLFPVFRQLHLSPEHTIDPPSSQLLAVHYAIARILKLSGAGEYIENILREMEDTSVKDDGSTNLGRLLSWGLRGWFKFASTGILAN
ncbi:HNH endonuclease signature motif containing protein [Aspergillus tanneri]|uniref:HNH nuclease domain-containing protein n=1 Tax=Aspergillus tanneri TaxID=1220188 RepID=A0A5M9M7R5_9EURO|nr:uncharacterized protein ATNIH1004_011676 [Aspergillus tanneri]KAA8641540.1 hypothetical protein ATNIH1004_011676 [Aspergillus tanneri]